jgi:hypothetical protein
LPSPPAAPIPDEEPSEEPKTISGEVLERIAVEKYTYLRLGEPGSAGTWTAVASTDGARFGERVSVRGAQLMTGFVSATLKRTFDAIYFGVLDGAAGTGAAAGNPHASSAASAGAMAVPTLPRAPGPLGRTIAELTAQRAALQGKPARVRGVVVKSIGGILGRTFLHVRDGSGDEKSGDNDLTVTTDSSPAVGERVLLEGTVVTDKDYGSGYRYPVLLEDARLLSE